MLGHANLSSSNLHGAPEDQPLGEMKTCAASLQCWETSLLMREMCSVYGELELDCSQVFGSVSKMGGSKVNELFRHVRSMHVDTVFASITTHLSACLM